MGNVKKDKLIERYFTYFTYFTSTARICIFT